MKISNGCVVFCVCVCMWVCDVRICKMFICTSVDIEHTCPLVRLVRLKRTEYILAGRQIYNQTWHTNTLGRLSKLQHPTVQPKNSKYMHTQTHTLSSAYLFLCIAYAIYNNNMACSMCIFKMRFNSMRLPFFFAHAYRFTQHVQYRKRKVRRCERSHICTIWELKRHSPSEHTIRMHTKNDPLNVMFVILSWNFRVAMKKKDIEM